MPKDPQLRGEISKRSNDDLLRMVNNDFADYGEEAIEYAEDEMRLRGISIENYEIRNENPPRIDGQVSQPKLEASNKGYEGLTTTLKTPTEITLLFLSSAKSKVDFLALRMLKQ